MSSGVVMWASWGCPRARRRPSVRGGLRRFGGGGYSPGNATGRDVAVVAVCGRSLGPPVFCWSSGVVTWHSGGLCLVLRGDVAVVGASARSPGPLVPPPSLLSLSFPGWASRGLPGRPSRCVVWWGGEGERRGGGW